MQKTLDGTVEPLPLASELVTFFVRFMMAQSYK
jgi:hypothetical protein